MATLVYSKTITDRGNEAHATEYPGTQVSLDRKYTLWQSTDKVGVAVSVLRHGVYRKNKAKWYKWGTTGAFGLRRTSTGRPMPYHAYRAESLRPTDKWSHLAPTAVFDFLNGEHQFNKEAGEEFLAVYKQAMDETFKVKSMYDVYPMAEAFGIWQYQHIQKNIRASMRESDIVDMTTALFGKTRANRDWFNAVQNADPYVTAVTHQFRGLVDDKYLLHFLKNNDFSAENHDTGFVHTPRLRPLIKHITKSSRMDLLKGGLDQEGYFAIRAVCGDGINVASKAQRLEQKVRDNGLLEVNAWTGIDRLTYL